MCSFVIQVEIAAMTRWLGFHTENECFEFCQMHNVNCPTDDRRVFVIVSDIFIPEIDAPLRRCDQFMMVCNLSILVL